MNHETSSRLPSWYFSPQELSLLISTINLEPTKKSGAGNVNVANSYRIIKFMDSESACSSSFVAETLVKEHLKFCHVKYINES